ncbi:hypothetical protein KXS11_10435 [Plantibacter flavus]|uniref:hypothetical protein n=1 Tax=Plantibacter flavus TaxID=150123 RepID=UPI003F1645B6
MTETHAGSKRGGLATAVIALVLSALALAVSVFTFVAPIRGQVDARNTAVEAFLDRIVDASTLSQISAGAMTQAGSAANDYVQIMGYIWEGWEYAEGLGGVDDGTYTQIDSGYKVCFPQVDVLTAECQVFDRFQFADGTDTITRFSIDEVPVEKLVNLRSSSVQAGESVPSAHLRGTLFDPTFESKSVVLSIGLNAAESYPVGTTIELSSVRIQDAGEHWLPDPVFELRPTISRYESVRGVLRTSGSANLVYACWTVQPTGTSTCAWMNLSL